MSGSTLALPARCANEGVLRGRFGPVVELLCGLHGKISRKSTRTAAPVSARRMFRMRGRMARPPGTGAELERRRRRAVALVTAGENAANVARILGVHPKTL